MAPQFRFYHLFESYFKRLESTFSQFQGKNITVRYKNIVTYTLTHTGLSVRYNNKKRLNSALIALTML